MLMTLNTLKLINNQTTSQVDLDRKLSQLSEMMHEVKVTVESWKGSETVSLWHFDSIKVDKRMAKSQKRR